MMSMPTFKKLLPWTVPITLISGITLCLVANWPLYIGLLIGLIWSCFYARYHRHGWREIWTAMVVSVRMMMQVGVALLFIGMVVSLWMRTGTIPTLTGLASSFVTGHNIIWVSFAVTSVLSMVIGSAVATWSILGVPLLVLSDVHLMPIVAGALVSGAMVGDRSSPMSTSVVLMSSVTEVPYKSALSQMIKTVVIPFLLTVGLYYSLNRFLSVGHDRALTWTSVHHVSNLWYLLPPALVIVLALRRVKLLYNLLVAYFLAVVIRLLQHSSVTGVVQDTFHGVTLAVHGHSEVVGGILTMLPAVTLVLVAGAFQGATNLGGSIHVLTRTLFSESASKLRFMITVFGTCIVFSLIMGTQMLTLLMCGDTLRGEFEKRDLTKKDLLQMVGDAPELIPPLVPWNLLGIQAYTILNVSTLAFLPYAWYIYVALMQSAIFLWFGLRSRSKLRRGSHHG